MDCTLQGQLIAGHLSCGFDPASTRHADVADTLLFAQWVAQKRHSPFAAFALWFSEHSRSLRELKWLNTDFQSTTQALDAAEVVTLAALAEQHLLGRLPEQAASRVRQMMECVGCLPPDSPVQVALRQSVLESPEPLEQDDEPQALRGLTLMLSAVDVAGHLELMCVHLRTRTVFEQDFFQQPVSGAEIDGLVQLNYQRLEWNASGYNDLRDKVKAYLAVQPQDRVWPIHCEPEPALTAPDSP